MLLVVGLSACQQALQPPYPPVPPLRAEAMGKPPVTETLLIWQPGHWDWTDGAYEWVPGSFVPREGHGELWMPGYWEKAEDGWH